jgi:acyl-ACP thioesterase
MAGAADSRDHRVIVVARDASDLAAPLPEGRTFTNHRRPGFGDCAPSGRMRLDALACWLQDVAYADVDDAGLAQAAVWVVRRTRIRVNRFPRFGERFACTTFCSGLGRMWAERRTDVVAAGEREAAVQAVSLWVHLDVGSWRPVPLTEEEIGIYGPSAVPKRVSARLRHPAPDPSVARELRRWEFRRTDCDVADHVNNAAYWRPVEEELLADPAPEPQRLDTEIEYRTPAQAEEMRVLGDGPWRWILSPADDVHASILVEHD